MRKLSKSLKLKNCLDEQNKINAAVAKMADSFSYTQRILKELILVLEELFTNVVTHGYNDKNTHYIDLLLWFDEKTISIRMVDDGKPFDITETERPDTTCAIEKRLVGGLGVHFLKHFIDECTYCRDKGKNIVTLKKYVNREKPEEKGTNNKTP